jgi:hypothetical protein
MVSNCSLHADIIRISFDIRNLLVDIIAGCPYPENKI